GAWQLSSVYTAFDPTSLQPSILLRAQVQEPIAIDARGCRTPRVRHFSCQEGSRKLLEQPFAPLRQGSRSHGGQCPDGLFVKVTTWHGRVGLSLAPEEALDIAAIFEQQRIGFVFRMPLEKDEQAASVFDERVDAALLRPREDTIAARRQGVLRDIVPPGMGHPQSRRHAGRQGVTGEARAVEDAEALVAERTPADAICAENRG